MCSWGNKVLEILDVGTNEPEDTCYYPEEDMYMQKSNVETIDRKSLKKRGFAAKNNIKNEELSTVCQRNF